MSDYSLMNLDILREHIEIVKKFDADFIHQTSTEYTDARHEFLSQLRPQLHARGEVTLTREQAEEMVRLVVHADIALGKADDDIDYMLHRLTQLSENPWFKIASKIRSIFVK